MQHTLSQHRYEQHQAKQSQKLFPQYSSNKKIGFSPIKQTLSMSSEEALQIHSTSSPANKTTLPHQQSFSHSETQQTQSHQQSSTEYKSTPIVNYASTNVTIPGFMTSSHDSDTNISSNSLSQQSPKCLSSTNLTRESQTKPMSRFSAMHSATGEGALDHSVAPIVSSRLDLNMNIATNDRSQMNDRSLNYLNPPQQSDGFQLATSSRFINTENVNGNNGIGTTTTQLNLQDLPLSKPPGSNNNMKQPQHASKTPSLTSTPIIGAYKSNELLHSHLLSPSSKAGLITSVQMKGPVDALVQSVVLHNSRSKSPSSELKSSTNMGFVSSSNRVVQVPNNIQASYFTNPTQSTAANASRMQGLQTASPAGQRTNSSKQSGSNSPKQKPVNGSVLTQNYYKVASQIRRNQVKDLNNNSPSANNSEKRDFVATGGLTGSTFAGHAYSSTRNLGSQTPFSGLTVSQNVGRAVAPSHAQFTIPQASRSPVGAIKRQKSSGSVEGRVAGGGGEITAVDPRKRFAVVDKLNEKYTKKMIIDLCNNHMNNSQESGQSTGKRGSNDVQPFSLEDTSRDNFHASKSNKNPNMNMLDMLSQQRVSQRSVSSSKRQQLHGIQETSCDKFKGLKHENGPTSSNSSTKRLSFRLTEKPWENNSFGSRFGSFSAMRSASNSGAATSNLNSQASQQPQTKNWNIDGSKNFNSVSSQPTEITTSVVQVGAKSTVSDLDNQASKNSIMSKGTYILKGFNDSQEIHSSRNFQIERKTNYGSQNKGLDTRNVLTKNITSADLSSPSPQNPNIKYKFTSSHLNKPTTSSNSFAKSQQQPMSQSSQNLQPQQSSRGQAKAVESNQSGSNSSLVKAKNSTTQPSSPLPNSTQNTNSKHSSKSEIKKSIVISDTESRSSIHKERLSSNTYSQSFEEQENVCREGEDEEDCQDDEGELDNDFDDEGEDIDAFGGEDNKSHTSEHSGTCPISPFMSGQSQSTAGSQHLSYSPGYHNSGSKGASGYNFEAQLEYHPDVQINMDELKKERAKLIRKIISTFKVKNKALSTSQEYYKILHVVGKGAFAKVCLAIQLLTGKLVAIKLIDKQILRSDSAKKRVLQEVHILKKLNGHKHVLKLLEVFENRKLIFIVTEYFHGQDLMKMMKERNGMPYTEDQVRHMLVQILSGLRYIHSNMVLHRDIKLDNLLVDSAMNLKIIDFGISRVIQKDQRMTEQCGTPAFLAPEIISNKGYEGFGSDFWSLGVLIYILLYGRVPFKGNNLNELHRNILNGVLPKEEMKEVNVSFEAQDLIFRILRLKPRERIGWDGIVQSPWMRGFPIPDGMDNDPQQQYNATQAMFLQNNYNSVSINGDPTMTAASSIKTSLAMPNDQFDERVIGYIEGFGYSREYILRCLVKGSLSHVNAMYKLLKKA